METKCDYCYNKKGLAGGGCKHLICANCVIYLKNNKQNCPFCQTKIDREEVKDISTDFGKEREKKIEIEKFLDYFRAPMLFLKQIRSGKRAKEMMNRLKNKECLDEKLRVIKELDLFNVLSLTEGSEDKIVSKIKTDEFKKNFLAVLYEKEKQNLAKENLVWLNSEIFETSEINTGEFYVKNCGNRDLILQSIGVSIKIDSYIDKGALKVAVVKNKKKITIGNFKSLKSFGLKQRITLNLNLGGIELRQNEKISISYRPPKGDYFILQSGENYSYRDVSIQITKGGLTNILYLHFK